MSSQATDRGRSASRPLSSGFRWLFVNPVPALVWVLCATALGVIGYRSMTKESLPDLPIPQALVTIVWPDAPPETVEKEITIPLERELRELKGLKDYRSGSMNSTSIVAVQFRPEVSIPDAMSRLRAKIATAEADFPRGTEKPLVEQISVRDYPIAIFALTGAFDDAQIAQVAEGLKKRLERTSGVKRVSLDGVRRQCIRVELLPSQLRSLSISPTVVRDCLLKHNRDVPFGSFDHDQYAFSMKMDGSYNAMDSLRNLPIVTAADSRVIRLGEIARINQGREAKYTMASLSRRGASYRNAVTLSVFKLPGRDTNEVVQKAIQSMEYAKLGNRWLPGLDYEIVSDESQVIDEELRRTMKSGWQAAAIVFVVLMLLLGWREAAVAAMGIPLTVLAAIGVLWAIGYTFNVMVLIGIVLALGMLVDDFILMMEGMHHYAVVQRMRFGTAAWQTIKAYAIPSLSGSATTILVLIPLAVIGGIDGKFIRILPVTAAICLVASYVLSIFVAIPLSKFFLKRPKQMETEGPSKLAWADRITASAERLLHRMLSAVALRRKRRAMGLIAIAMILFAGSIGAYLNLSSELYPKEDGRNLGVTIELPVGTPLLHSQQTATIVGEVLRAKPYFSSILQVVGARDPFSSGTLGEMLGENTGPHLIGFSCRFTPREQRDRLGFEYVAELRRAVEDALQDEPGSVAFFTPEVGGSTSDDPVQIDLIGEDMSRLREIAANVEEVLRAIPGTRDVRNNLGQPRIQASYTPRRDVLAIHGIEEAEMAEQVRLCAGFQKCGKFRRSGTADDYDIYLGCYWPGRTQQFRGPVTWEQLRTLTIIDRQGKSIPLAGLTRVAYAETDQSIVHKDGRRCVTVKAKTDGVTAAHILNQLRPQLDGMYDNWPPGYTCEIAGEEEQAEDTYASVGRVFLVSIFLVFSMLVLLFNSFRQPAIILSSVLFGLTGVFWGFYVLDISFSFTAAIGIVSLVGINVNDAIVMVDTMNRHRRAGLPVAEAAARGAADRLRPILSTTITTVLGLMPLLTNPGWRPLCLAIILGEIVSSPLCLLLIPCLYLLLTRNVSPSHSTSELYNPTDAVSSLSPPQLA